MFQRLRRFFPPLAVVPLHVMLFGFLLVFVWLVVTVIQLEVKTPSEESTAFYSKLALVVLLSWIALLVAYYAWLIYFYNYNFGKSAAFWEKFMEMAHLEKGLKTEAQLMEEFAAPNKNPFYDQTFGLPPGTVRGTLALTVSIGGLCLLILVIGRHPIFAIPALNRSLNFFEQAFLMVMAFYFGTKAFEIIQQQQTERVKAQAKNEQEDESSKTPTEEEMDAAVPASPKRKEIGVSQPSSSVVVKPTTAKEKAIDANLSLFYPHVRDLEAHGILQEEDIEKFAKEWELDTAAVKAVITVESSGKGFLKDGRPKILFEGHVFWKQLKKHNVDPIPLAKSHPTVVYPKWTKQYYLTGALEYNRLNEAKAIHESAALESASWGMFQIMGYHWSAMKYGSVQAYVEEQEESEAAHLKAFGRFISEVNKNCLDALQKRDWAKFARHYNGSEYAKNQYDTKLARWYEKYNQPSTTLV